MRLSLRVYAEIVAVSIRLLALSALVSLTATGQEHWFCDGSTLIWAKDRRSDVPLFRVVSDGKVGYIDSTGRLVIPHRFDLTFNYLWDFVEGVAPVQVGQKWGYIDPKGMLVIPAVFEWVTPFSEGRALVRLGNDGPPYKIGFIDKNGEFVGEPNVSSISEPFSEGLAAVLHDDKWGYVDLSGKIAIQPTFAWARSFSSGLASVIEKGGCEVYENACNWMNVPLGFSKKNGPLPACHFSFIDHEGKTIYSGFLNTQEFSEGLAGVRTSRRWGFIARDGSKAFPETFEAVKPFHDGLAAVRINNKWGFIDRSGKVVIQPQFDSADDFSDGIGLVMNNGRYMFITKTGHQLYGRTFSIAAPFASGLAHVALEERTDWEWAYINHNGKIVYQYIARE